MPYKDLRDFIDKLEAENELKRIKAEVDWYLELSHIAKLNEEEKGPALLFENVKGYKTPVFTSAFSTTEKLALTLEMPTTATIPEMAREWVSRTKEKIPPKTVSTGPCKENIDMDEEVDLLKFPIPHMFEHDGGRYIGTACCVITKDPETGWINVGTYRQMVHDKKTIGVQILRGKDADLHRMKYAERGEPMPVAVAIGVDPVIFTCSSTLFPPGECEYDYVGALRGSPVEVVKGETVDLPIPATAEIVLEGEIDPEALKDEGPFGEYTGYYSAFGAPGPSPKPFAKIKCVTYRDNPIHWTTTVGMPITDTHMIQSLNRTSTLWSQLEALGVPGIKSVYLPPASGGRFIAIVSVKQIRPGHANQVGTAVISTPTGEYGIKVIIVVDDDIDPTNMAEVLWAISMRCQPLRDVQLIKRGRDTSLDPSIPAAERTGMIAITSRMIIDATLPYEWEVKPTKVALNEEVVKRVKAKWEEYFPQ